MYYIAKKDNFLQIWINLGFVQQATTKLESFSYNTQVCTRSSIDIYSKFKFVNKRFSQYFFHIVSTTVKITQYYETCKNTAKTVWGGSGQAFKESVAINKAMSPFQVIISEANIFQWTTSPNKRVVTLTAESKMSGNIREQNYFYMPIDNPKHNQTIYLRYTVQVHYTMNITVI